MPRMARLRIRLTLHRNIRSSHHNARCLYSNHTLRYQFHRFVPCSNIHQGVLNLYKPL